MRALIFEGPGDVSYSSDRGDPEIVDDRDAIVTIEGAGLCGSDLHPYLGREPARTGVTPGHEGVGRVAKVGSRVGRISVGDRVVIPFTSSCGSCQRCREGLSSRCLRAALFGWGDPADSSIPALDGMQAEMVRVPMADSTLVPIPDSLPIAAAVLASDNLPTGWYAVRRSDLAAGSTLVVIGAGSVGLCAIAAGHHIGAGEIVSIDPVAERRSTAAAMGARALAPDDPALDGLPPTGSIVDAAGTGSSQRLAARLACPGATISMIAVQTEPQLAIPPAQIYDSNLTIRSGRAPVRSILDEVLPILDTSLDPTPLVFDGGSTPLSAGPETYRRFAERRIIKTWFDPRS